MSHAVENVPVPITTGDLVRFIIVCGREADDPLSKSLSAGVYPWGPTSGLMSQLFQPEARVLDIGAHIGTVALLAAAKGCQVVAVEASPRNAELLRHSAAINGFTSLRVVQAAVCDRPGILSFCSKGPFGHVATSKFESPSVQVPAVTVEQLLKKIGWDRIDFIKIDVEGSEMAVIDGMAPFLARADAPPILYESNSFTLDYYDKTPSQLKARLESFGYRNFVVGWKKFHPVAADDFQPEVVTDYFAVKQIPAVLQTWEVGLPCDQAEITARFLIDCSQDSLKVHIARMLRSAPAWLLENGEVVKFLKALRRDPKSEVRAAVAWTGKWLEWYKWKGKLKRAWKKGLKRPA